MTVPYWVLVRVVPPHRTPPTPHGPGEASLGLVGGVEVASVEGAGLKDADPAVEVVAAGRDRNSVLDARVGTKIFPEDWAWSPPSRRIPSNRATATAQARGRLTLPGTRRGSRRRSARRLGRRSHAPCLDESGDGVLPRLANRAQRRWLIRAVKVVPA
jgi:hypothetical protein